MATQFDHIVVGAGPAGCVVAAARLSEDRPAGSSSPKPAARPAA